MHQVQHCNGCSSHPFRFSSATIRMSLRLLSSTGFVKTLQSAQFSSQVTCKGQHNDLPINSSVQVFFLICHESEHWFNTEEVRLTRKQGIPCYNQ